MTGFVRADAMGYAFNSAPAYSEMSVNDQDCSEANVRFDNNGFNFELFFGSCGMGVLTVDDAIVFETKLRKNFQISKFCIGKNPELTVYQ